jgi:outer membrane lipoprotein carrier protein
MLVDIIGFLFTAQLGSAAPAKAQPPAPPPVTAPAAKLTAVDVVNDVQKFYANIKQVTAQFRQTVKNSTFGTEKTSDGKVWLAKPGKMRWDYYEVKKGAQTQTKKSFISNGTTLYVVEHDNKQVVKKDLKQDLLPVAVTFLYGTGDLKKEFSAALDTSGTYGGKSDLVLKLTPKQPSAQYKNLYLVVNKSDYHVSQSVIVDSSNNVNHFQFFAPDFEAPVKDTWFEFDPRSVPNYRVVDADQPQQAPAPVSPPAKK